jgi:hypothetical protein
MRFSSRGQFRGSDRFVILAPSWLWRFRGYGSFVGLAVSCHWQLRGSGSFGGTQHIFYLCFFFVIIIIYLLKIQILRPFISPTPRAIIESRFSSGISAGPLSTARARDGIWFAGSIRAVVWHSAVSNIDTINMLTKKKQ